MDNRNILAEIEVIEKDLDKSDLSISHVLGMVTTQCGVEDSNIWKKVEQYISLLEIIKNKYKTENNEIIVREIETQTHEIILNGSSEIAVKRNNMSNLNNKQERKYCRNKWGKDWWRCDKAEKKQRKEEARDILRNNRRNIQDSRFNLEY